MIQSAKEEHPFVSRVANVVLVTALENEKIAVSQMNAYLRSKFGEHVLLRNVREYAGGGKRLECDVFIVAVSHLNIPDFLDVFRQASWNWPEEVQLMIKDQEDTIFSIHSPAR